MLCPIPRSPVLFVGVPQCGPERSLGLVGSATKLHDEHSTSNWRLEVSGPGGTRILGLVICTCSAWGGLSVIPAGSLLLKETSFVARDLWRKMGRKQGSKSRAKLSSRDSRIPF
jgi:hypothetical protein